MPAAPRLTRLRAGAEYTRRCAPGVYALARAPGPGYLIRDGERTVYVSDAELREARLRDGTRRLTVGH